MSNILTHQEWPRFEVGGVTLRKVGDTEVLKEQAPALLTVVFNGHLNVSHLSVVLFLLSYALVDKEKVQANRGCGTTDTNGNTHVKWLTDNFTGWSGTERERERERNCLDGVWTRPAGYIYPPLIFLIRWGKGQS